MARFLKDRGCYYIQSQGRNNEEIFKSDSDYEKYIHLLKKYKLQFQISVYGYCLTTTAARLIARPNDSSKLPLFMRGINQSYALFFNSRYNRTGKVWGQRYKSVLINNDYDFFECVKLVEFIPVKEERSRSPVEYPWSSCSARILGLNSTIDAIPPAGPGLSEQF